MKERPLDEPMKYESEFSTPRTRGEACTRKVSSFTAGTDGDCDSFLEAGADAVPSVEFLGETLFAAAGDALEPGDEEETAVDCRDALPLTLLALVGEGEVDVAEPLVGDSALRETDTRRWLPCILESMSIFSSFSSRRSLSSRTSHSSWRTRSSNDSV